MTYTETVNRARRSNSNSRLADLQAVTNAARRAHKNVTANEAIALYCGFQLKNLRSFKQCLEMGLKPAEIHTLPTIDIWGSNSQKWCEQTGAARFYPKAAFDCSNFLKVDGHEPAADIPAEPMSNSDTAEEIGRDYVEALEEAGRITEEEAAAMTATAATKKPRGKAKGKAAKVETAPAPAMEYGTVDDLPF